MKLFSMETLRKFQQRNSGGAGMVGGSGVTGGSNTFVKTTQTGYGTRLGNSIKGIGFGLLLFFGSFVLLYWNEGRVDLSTVADDAVQADAAELSSELDGKQVFVTSEIAADGGPIGDQLFLLEGDYMALNRNVEMYAWVQHTSSSSDTNLGGSETTTTEYSYKQEWVSSTSVPDSSQFEMTGYSNPSPKYTSESFYADGGKIGVYGIALDEIELPEFKKLTLNEENFRSDGLAQLKAGYAYVDYSANGSDVPELGDLRVSYEVIEPGMKATVFGKLEGSDIVTFVDSENDGAKIYRMFKGSRDEAIATFHDEHVFMTWVLRGVGFLMMWFGLSSVFSVLSVLLDVLPFLGSVSRGILGLITFLVAAVLSAATILISMILHNVIAVVVTVLVVIGITVFVLKKKGNKPTVVKA
ncbi:TMEM43 family protein [Candidatus Peregrinibacteria bacterium]|nr:TMEM43 family protein [Candidatus Peregrinibacteria bacterium]